MNKEDEWIKYHPDKLKSDFIACALFIAVFESFKDYIVEEVQGFFITGLSDGKLTISEEYNRKVLGRKPSVLYASLDFLKEFETITTEDIELFTQLKEYRNRMSHEMIQHIFENDLSELPEMLSSMMQLRKKIEKWWILNVEIPTDPDWDNQEIDEDQIITSSEMVNKMLLDILSGDKETSEQYCRAIKEYYEKIK